MEPPNQRDDRKPFAVWSPLFSKTATRLAAQAFRRIVIAPGAHAPILHNTSGPDCSITANIPENDPKRESAAVAPPDSEHVMVAALHWPEDSFTGKFTQITVKAAQR
jgi:hypothetical protein